MKEEKQKLVLTKKTIARLNNLEMHHIRGGDGDETEVTRQKCGSESDLDPVGKILDQATKIILSKMLTVCLG